MFHVGQMVVCVDDTPKPPPCAPIHPDSIWVRKGNIYTVRGVGMYRAIAVLFLDEAVNKAWRFSGEVGFDQRRFRPVRTTSIDVFTAILTKTPEHVDA